MPFQNDILAGASGAGETEYQLWGWGENGRGQLGQNAPGDGSKADQATPMEIFHGHYEYFIF